jgi:glycosyltransferase involved in cell wall biosynthesis
MPRLAWFTPLPPVRSGIAAYNEAILPPLAGQYAIDVFTDPAPRADRDGPPTGPSVFGAHEFAWRHDRSPYDLVVYQLGNATCHDFMWPHLPRYPGLVVLHDGQLHHARSKALLSRGRYDDYRAEFRYNHPDAPADLAELVIATWGGSFFYLYPMLRWVLESARLVAVHGRGLAVQLGSGYPGVEVTTVPMGMPDPIAGVPADAGRAVRARHAIPDEAVLFAAFGLVTPEKRISAGLRGLAALVAEGIDAYLLLAGGTADYYDARAEARALGIDSRLRITGYVPDEEFPAHLLAADACLCLRWPTSRETSAAWVHAIAAGRPTIVTALAHTTDAPCLEPRTWEVVGGGEPVTVAVDLLEEDECVRLAMRRLATDAALRASLGRTARAHWRTAHTMEGAVAGYVAAIERALARPLPRIADLPAHLLNDGTGLARALTAELGVALDLFD